MSPSFQRGAREGLEKFVPISMGLIPWAIVTGIAMRSVGLSPLESMGMSFLVYAATAQIGTLPLIVAGVPLWIIFLTGLVLNVRFVIFSAAISPAFHDSPWVRRLLGGFLMTDLSFSLLSPKLLAVDDADWRWGYYIVPSIYGWILWQSCVLAGVFGAGLVPSAWSLEFMGTIALIIVIVPMIASKPMLLAAIISGLGAVFLREVPMRLGLIVAIFCGIAAGVVAERWRINKAEST